MCSWCWPLDRGCLLHRGHCRRDRLPARHLDGRLPPAGVARGLRALLAASADHVPERLATGICFEHVAFAYPGTERLVSMTFARTTRRRGRRDRRRKRRRQDTLVKLLAKMYEPTPVISSSIDSTSPGSRPPTGGGGWPARSRTSSASISVPVTRSAWAICPTGRRVRGRRAVERAGADDVVERLPTGSRRSSARPGPAASICSFGQWQKLALARGFMRDGPCCWCSTNRPRPSTPRPNTRSSSATRAARAKGDHGDASHPGLASVLDRPHGRPDRRSGRRPGCGSWHPRGAHGRGDGTRSSTTSRPPRIGEGNRFSRSGRLPAGFVLARGELRRERRRATGSAGSAGCCAWHRCPPRRNRPRP